MAWDPSRADLPGWQPVRVTWRPREGKPGLAVEAFEYHGHARRVAGLSDWWPDERVLYLKVRTISGEWYLLAWNQDEDEWRARFLVQSDA